MASPGQSGHDIGVSLLSLRLLRFPWRNGIRMPVIFGHSSSRECRIHLHATAVDMRLLETSVLSIPLHPSCSFFLSTFPIFPSR